MIYSKENSQFEHIEHSQMNKIKFFVIDLSYTPPHFHNDFEIVQVIEGKVNIFTSEGKIEMQSGEIALFNPYAYHSLESIEKACTLLVIQVDPGFCELHYPQMRNTRFSTINVTKVAPFNTCLDIINLFFNLGYNYYSAERGYELKCISDLYKLFWYFITSVPHEVITEKDFLTQKKQQNRFVRITNYIQDHYMEKITLSEIAERENLSMPYLSHLFKDKMNMNFQDYVNKLRLEKALFLLDNTNMNTLEISLASGFSDSKYLNKHFHQTFPITLKEYKAGKMKRLTTISDSQAALPSSHTGRNQYIYTKEEGLALLKKHHHYSVY